MKNLITLSLVIAVQWAAAQTEIKTRKINDPFFPAKGRFNAGFITTYSGAAPPLTSDFTYGFSRKFSMGVIAGTTGTLGVLGIKLNVLLAQPTKQTRVIFRFASIYCPGRDGTFLFDRSTQHIYAAVKN